jgi:hypothetical protein
MEAEADEMLATADDGANGLGTADSIEGERNSESRSKRKRQTSLRAKNPKEKTRPS